MGIINELFSEKETRTAIKILKIGKATGLDSILHDVWKELMCKFEDLEKDGFCNASCNIAKCLTLVFNDISERPGFLREMVMPSVKKNRTDIGNYCPIMVLNTDYKVMIKVLAMRLGKVAPSIIHSSQAGFIKGCKIEDQTELAHLMTTWCEMSETNGMIICLD